MNFPFIALVLVVSQGPQDSAAAAAKEKLKPFKVALKTALTKALETSPSAAVDACAKQAPELAKEFSTGGVTVGRTASKLRNDKNTGPAWLKGPLEALSKEKSGTDAYRLVALPGGRVGYAEALWVQPMCLTCHGSTVDPSLAATIKAKYPADHATGFSEGDFRGVFWIELPKP